MKGIIESKDLPEEVKIYFKKDWLGYRVVQPTRNPDGSINWFNALTGGWRNIINLFIYIVIAVLLLVGINQLIHTYQYIASNPCEFCIDCIDKKIVDVINISLGRG